MAFGRLIDRSTITREGAATRLLIYIPSHERFDRLLKQMERIRAHADGVETSVLIVDNGSTDPRYLDLPNHVDLPGTRIVRNAVNVGGPANVARGFVEGGEHDYVWILSDDDLIAQDAIPRIRAELSVAPPPDLIFLSMETASRTELADSARIYETIWQGLGLISRTVYRSARFAPYARVGFDYVHTGFPHLAVALTAAASQPLVLRTLRGTDFFSGEPPAPPSEGPSNYVPSLFGFPLLADAIPSPELRRRLIWRWILDARPAMELAKAHPDRYRNVRSYIAGQSPLLGALMRLRVLEHHLGRPVQRARALVRSFRWPSGTR